MLQASTRTMDRTAYELVQASPFAITRVHKKPTWTNKVTLVKEMSTLKVQVNFTYDWALDCGLLAEVMGEVDYNKKYAPLVY